MSHNGGAGFFGGRTRVLRRSVSIRIHLAIFTLLVALPLLAAGLVAARIYANSEREALTAQTQDIAADATAALDQELNRARLAVQVLAASEGIAEARFEQLYARAKQVAESIPDSAIAMRRPGGETIFATSQPYNQAVQPETDPRLLATDKLSADKRVPVISDLVGGKMLPSFVALDVPVVSFNRTEFILTLGISPKGVLDIVTARRAQAPITVTDNNDRVIAKSGNNASASGQKASDTFIRETQGQAGSFTDTPADGAAVFNVYRRLEMTGWRIAAGIPVSELEAPLQDALNTLMIIAGAGLLLSLVLAFLYGRIITKPLRAVRAFAVAQDGDARAVRTGISELDHAAGALMRASIARTDSTVARSRMLDEMNRRMHNMLGIVRAIADQTRQRAMSLDQFGASFSGRLAAFEKSHHALGDRAWQGGDLKGLIAQCCEPFGEAARFDLSGPAIELTQKAAVGVGMVVHELAGNAAKFGALGRDGGSVKVTWDIPAEDSLRILRLKWEEVNGPPAGAPRKEGFGTVLMRAIVEGDFGGRLETFYTRDGLHSIICIPMDALVDPSIVPQGGDDKPVKKSKKQKEKR